MARFREHQDDLEQALAAVRREARAGAPRLSGAARSRILTEVARQAATRPLWPGLFAPPSRLWLASGLPVLLAAALFAVVHRPVVEAPPLPSGAPASVLAAKVGDRVEFTIANGHRSHRVYRSTAPDGFREGVKVTDGSYAERLDDGSSIVYFRID